MRSQQEDWDLYNELKALRGIDNHDVNYAIGKNLVKLKQEVNIHNRSQKAITKIGKAYDDAHKKIMEKHSGGAMTPNKIGTYDYVVPPAKQDEMRVELNALELKYAIIIEERKEKMEEFFEHLENTESDVDLWMLDEDRLPKEDGKRLLTEQFNAILPFLRFKQTPEEIQQEKARAEMKEKAEPSKVFEEVVSN